MFHTSQLSDLGLPAIPRRCSSPPARQTALPAGRAGPGGAAAAAVPVPCGRRSVPAVDPQCLSVRPGRRSIRPWAGARWRHEPAEGGGRAAAQRRAQALR